MNQIYNTPAISFINKNTQDPITHPEGDYSQLNLKLKRLQYLLEKYQPQQPIVLLYEPPAESKDIINGANNSDSSEKAQLIENISFFRSSFSPSHGFTVPAIGNNPAMLKIINIENFNDFNTHLSVLDQLLNDVLSRVESEYGEHPLHYNKRVQFRKASYIDDRQAFSFWPVGKPSGEYPLTKPFFDKVIEQLNATDCNYHVVIDFVTDWEDQKSSFDGPPKSYAIEVAVFFDNNQLPTMRTLIDRSELKLCQNSHDFLDQHLAPMLEQLSMNIPQWYDSMQNINRPKI